MNFSINVLRRFSVIALSSLLLSLVPCQFATAQPATEPFAPLDPFDQIATMHRGINALGWDPLWNDPTKARFQLRHFARIHDAGFDTMRMVLHSFPHMDSSNQIDPDWFRTVDRLLAGALDAGLTVILDEHDDTPCSADAAACREKLNAAWRQIAAHFQNAPNRVLFEILNEPHAQLTAPVWNDLLRQVLTTIRATNPTRNVVIGPAGWSSVDQLPSLDLPADDQHIIVTVHYYWPMTFTHQGAPWVESTKNLSGVSWGTAAERKKIATDFGTVKTWSDAHHRPIFLGEFGSYERGDIVSRMRYTYAVARTAEAYGFPWSYWQFDGDFIAYDLSKDDWVQPILYALIPPQDPAPAPR